MYIFCLFKRKKKINLLIAQLLLFKVKQFNQATLFYYTEELLYTCRPECSIVIKTTNVINNDLFIFSGSSETIQQRHDKTLVSVLPGDCIVIWTANRRDNTLGQSKRAERCVELILNTQHFHLMSLCWLHTKQKHFIHLVGPRQSTQRCICIVFFCTALCCLTGLDLLYVRHLYRSLSLFFSFFFGGLSEAAYHQTSQHP